MVPPKITTNRVMIKILKNFLMAHSIVTVVTIVIRFNSSVNVPVQGSHHPPVFLAMTLHSPVLFVSQCIDRFNTDGPLRGNHSREYSGDHQHSERSHGHPKVDLRVSNNISSPADSRNLFSNSSKPTPSDKPI